MKRILGDDWLLPQLDDANRAWFTSGRLTLRQCRDCAVLQHPPEEVCASCQGTEFGEFQSRGAGRVESVAVVHHPVHPALADVVPYAVLLVSLDDAPGIHVVGNAVGCPPEILAIGDRVNVAFEEVEAGDGGEALKIPQWRRVEP